MHKVLRGCRGPWASLKDTGQITRRTWLAAEFSTLVDRLTYLTPSPRLTGLSRSLLTTQWPTFTVAVTMPFSLQYPFNFNVEISVSWGNCRYQDLAGFRPRTNVFLPGSPVGLPCGIITNHQAFSLRKRRCSSTLMK